MLQPKMSDMDAYLPGWPSKSLVRKVRKHLRFYGMVPRDRHIWRGTWEWAHKVTYSYAGERPRWPSPHEIGAQYMFLLLADMNAHYALQLPYRAMKQPTPMVAAILAGNGQLQIGFGETGNG